MTWLNFNSFAVTNESHKHRKRKDVNQWLLKFLKYLSNSYFAHLYIKRRENGYLCRTFFVCVLIFVLLVMRFSSRKARLWWTFNIDQTLSIVILFGQLRHICNWLITLNVTLFWLLNLYTYLQKWNEKNFDLR